MIIVRHRFVLIIVMAIILATSGFTVDGSWDLVLPYTNPYTNINESLTFQFKRTTTDSNNIISNLYIYGCFLSQFLYEID